MTIIKGKIQGEKFQSLLAQNRSKIMKIIGVDGYDELPKLLEKYQAE